MEVKVTRSTILPFSNSHPSETPLTIFDRFAPNVYVASIHGFSAPTSSNAAIIHGLSKTLVHFPNLTGRFSTNSHGRPCLLIGGGGVLVVEATVSSRLEDFFPLEPFPNSRLLHPEVKNARHLLQLQLNRFRCGGLIVGITAHHRLADGKSMSSFFVAWGQATRGVHIDPLPVHDRSWLQPRCPPRIEFDHWGSHLIPLDHQQQHGKIAFHGVDCDPSTITNIMLHFSPEFITKLRARQPEKYTAFETLLGHLWRKITIARRLDDHVCTSVRLTVNGRRRLRPPVPNEFFGNLMLNAHPKAKAKDLIDGGVAAAARIIRQAVMDRGNDYFRSFIDFGVVHVDEKLVSRYEVEGNALSPDIKVASWLMFPFDKVDFGGGGSPCGLLRTWLPVDGLLDFIPATNKDGGVDVLVCLLGEHAKVLREMSHSLDDETAKLSLPAKTDSYSKM